MLFPISAAFSTCIFMSHIAIYCHKFIKSLYSNTGIPYNISCGKEALGRGYAVIATCRGHFFALIRGYGHEMSILPR
jgi:hypothetical protein